MFDCSIIIPTYNSEKTIRDALSSIELDKSWDYIIEVIIVDDGSTDDTVKSIEEFCSENENVKLVKKENGGVSSARNLGLKVANGDFIFFMDSDDILVRSVLEKMILIAKTMLVDVVLAKYVYYDLVNNITTPVVVNIPKSVPLDNLFIKNEILCSFITRKINGLSTLCNKLFSKKIIKSNRLHFDEKRTHGEDWEFNINYFIFSKTMYYLDETVYIYRLDGSQTLLKYEEGLTYGYIKGYQMLKKIIKDFSLTDIDRDLFVRLKQNTAENIISYIELDSVSAVEKKKLLAKNEIKEIFNVWTDLDKRLLGEFSLSRKDKVIYALLHFGFYHEALRLRMR